PGRRDTTSPPSLPDGVLKAYDALQYPSAHPNVFVDSNGRAIRATTQFGFLIFGQYEKNFPVQDLAAVFSIMVDNNTFDDAYVCALDVVQDKSRVIAKLVLTRKDFPEARKHVRFAVPFKPPSTDSVLEFRLFYMGHTYMAIKGIYITDPAIIRVEDLPPDDRLLPKPEGGIGIYNYDLKAQGTNLYNGTQKLTILGWSTYMWKDMKTYPWDGPYKGKTPSEFADLLVKYNSALTRTFCIDTWTSTIFPWKKVGNKFDLNQFDPTYMNNLRSLAQAFGSQGILVQLDLFDNVALWDHGDGMTWTRHPFHPSNGGPIRDERDGREEFYNPNPTVKALQEKYLGYMINSLKDLKNIIFEVCNEYNGGGGASWHNWVADVIKASNPSVLVSASCDVNVSVSDPIFRHSNIDITSSHSGEWMERDFSAVHQNVLDRLKGYGKPTLLSTDGSKENWAAQKNDMINTANKVVPQGFGLEYKELVEPVAQMITPLGVRIQPVPTPPTTPTAFCKGGEFVCIEGFDRQKIEGLG
ncbi:MAG: glycoside hydrolase family 5 protein, partial [Nitrospira sp.]|nr:glycoside hydrolase family 5 protein [Nitrospira sp.]